MSHTGQEVEGSPDDGQRLGGHGPRVEGGAGVGHYKAGDQGAVVGGAGQVVHGNDAGFAAALVPDDREPGRVQVQPMAVLATEFDSYLGRENADPVTDLVGYRQYAVWLSRDELEQMIDALRRLIRPVRENEPTADRAQYLLSPIYFPIEQAPTTQPSDDEASLRAVASVPEWSASPGLIFYKSLLYK